MVLTFGHLEYLLPVQNTLFTKPNPKPNLPSHSYTNARINVLSQKTSVGRGQWSQGFLCILTWYGVPIWWGI